MMKSFFETYSEVIRRPRNVIDSFLHSDESRWQHPFLFSLTGVLVILVFLLIFVDFSFEPAVPPADGESEELQQLAEWMELATVRAATQFLPLSMFLLLIPMLSLPGVFFFREQTDGFYANLILNTYAVGASMASFIFLIPAWLLLGLPYSDPFMNTTLPAISIAAIGLWIYKNYFQASGFLMWIRVVSSYITGYILFIFLKGFFAAVIGYMLFAINRIMELSGSA